MSDTSTSANIEYRVAGDSHDYVARRYGGADCDKVIRVLPV